MKTLFDIGANRGEVVAEGLAQGFDRVVAVEAAPRMVAELAANFYGDERVIPIRAAAAEVDGENVEFMECVEDGLSTLDRDWLLSPQSLYFGKPYTLIPAVTVTIDRLAELYGDPFLVKVDVEGAEDRVLLGMSCKPELVTFEWVWPFIGRTTDALIDLGARLGYEQFAVQFIDRHLKVPTEWFDMSDALHVAAIIDGMKQEWESGGWRVAGIRQPADAGMIWVR